jgi:hypothetical protein
MDTFFCILKNQLISEPIMALPRANHQYALITDAANSTADTACGLGATLVQIDKHGFFLPSPTCLLLESAAAVWGMYIFHKYLKRKKFILYTDLKPLEKMDHLHTKTMNRLQAALLEHNFIIQCKKGNIMLADYLLRLPPSHPKFKAAF